VLPDADVLIVDEAHHLEDEATHQLGWRLGERELLSRLERLWTPGVHGSGALPEALGFIGSASGPSLTPALGPTLEHGERAALQMGAAIRRFFERLARLLEDPELLASGGDDAALRISAAVRAGSGWPGVWPVWAGAAGEVQAAARAIVGVTAALAAR